jgi:uncharacterized protein YjbI with pentapeptide repeats
MVKGHVAIQQNSRIKIKGKIMKKILYVIGVILLAGEVLASDPDSVKKVERLLVQKENKIEQTLNLAGYDMRKFGSLNGKTLKEKLDFKNANLSGANFSGMNISNLHFENTNLEGANFSDASFENVKFKTANLTKANFSNAKLESTGFKNCKMNDVNFNGMDGIYGGFESSDLIGSVFEFVKLESWSFHRSILDNVLLKDSDLYRVSFEKLRSSNKFRRVNLKTNSVSGLGFF